MKPRLDRRFGVAVLSTLLSGVAFGWVFSETLLAGASCDDDRRVRAWYGLEPTMTTTEPTSSDVFFDVVRDRPECFSEDVRELALPEDDEIEVDVPSDPREVFDAYFEASPPASQQ